MKKKHNDKVSRVSALLGGLVTFFGLNIALSAPAYVDQPPTARFDITPSTTPIAVGTTGNQKITVTNIGPSNATDVVITYTSPTTPGITVNSVKTAAGSSCTLNGGSWVCPAVATLALNASTFITVNMTIASNVAPGISVGSNTAVNSNEFNPGNGAGESLFNIWGSKDVSAKAGDAFWFGFEGYYETYNQAKKYLPGTTTPYLPLFDSSTPGPSEEGGPIADIWPTTQANPPGGYNLIDDTTQAFFYSRPITVNDQYNSNPNGYYDWYHNRNVWGVPYGTAGYNGYYGFGNSSMGTGFNYPYGTDKTKTTDNRPTYSQIITTPVSIYLQEDPKVYWAARDNRRAWEIRTGIYLDSPSPIYICVARVDDGMYAAIDGVEVVEQKTYNGGVVNNSGLDPNTGGNYSAGYHEIVYRIVNRNNQFKSFEGGEGGFSYIGIGTKSKNDCSQANYTTLTRIAPRSDVVITSSPPKIALVKYIRNMSMTNENYNTFTNDITGASSSVDRNGRKIPTLAFPKNKLQYCITYENTGGQANNFVLTDDVPSNVNADTDSLYWSASTKTQLGDVDRPSDAVKLTAAADSDQGTLTTTGGIYNTGQLTLNIGNLAAGAKGTVCFDATVK